MLQKSEDEPAAGEHLFMLTWQSHLQPSARLIFSLAAHQHVHVKNVGSLDLDSSFMQQMVRKKEEWLWVNDMFEHPAVLLKPGEEEDEEEEL